VTLHFRHLSFRSLTACRPGSAAGFTLVELLVSVVVLGIATGALVQASNIALSSSRRSTAITEVQNLVNRDLKWLRWYGKAWNCASGSFATCTNQSPSALLRYSPQACSTIVANFLTDAAAANVTPSRPYAVPVALNQNQTLESVNGTPLIRTIRSAGASTNQSLLVEYSYAGQTPFNRLGSVLIEAGSWCDPA
jgi:prepilin-type N-terminal cleavage/methylation domain-containing protein